MSDVVLPFEHRQSAHCESGVAANLLSQAGVALTEPLAFGIGAGLSFFHMPLIKVGGYPLTAFRCLPGQVFRRAAKSLGVRLHTRRYRDPVRAMEELDAHLAAGRPVGLQVGVYWLPFFPPDLRFHFNAHNLVVYGRRGDDYLISDPTIDTPVVCPAAALRKARFAKGMLAPRGRLYYPERLPGSVDLPRAIRAGILTTCGRMLDVPIPFQGVRGIRFLAGRVRKWPARLEERQARLQLAQLIRMQEEIGTGGAGFRFLFGAFLQESAPLLGRPELGELSIEITDIGDHWREFALRAARICKQRPAEGDDYDSIAGILLECAAREERFFRKLKGLCAGWRPRRQTPSKCATS